MQDTDLECDPSFLNEAVVSVTGGIYSFRDNKGIEKSCNKRCAGLRVPGLEDAGEFSGAKRRICSAECLCRKPCEDRKRSISGELLYSW